VLQCLHRTAFTSRREGPDGLVIRSLQACPVVPRKLCVLRRTGAVNSVPRADIDGLNSVRLRNSTLPTAARESSKRAAARAQSHRIKGKTRAATRGYLTASVFLRGRLGRGAGGGLRLRSLCGRLFLQIALAPQLFGAR